jgi:hypothetical protein
MALAPKWKPGQSGNPQGGRALDDAAKRGRDFARKLLEDPEYLQALRRRLILGTEAPQVVAKIYDYCYGRPKEQIQIESTHRASISVIPTSQLSDHQLQVLHDVLQQAQPKEIAPPIDVDPENVQ